MSKIWVSVAAESQPMPEIDPKTPLANQHACTEYATYDLSEWPFVMVRIHGFKPSIEVFTAFLACFDELLSRRAPFCIAFDIRKAALVTYVSTLIKFLRASKPKIEQTLVCSTIITNSDTLKLALSVVFASQPPAKPNERVTNEAESQEFMDRKWADFVEATRAQPAFFE